MDNLLTGDGRLRLTIMQKVDHYFIVVFLLIVPAMTIYDLLQIYVTQTYDGARSAMELIWSSIPFLVLSAVFVVIQSRRLKFKEIIVRYTEDQFIEAVGHTVEQLNWQIECNDVQTFRAYRAWNWSASWGEMITIIKQKDKLLINSICDPNKSSSVASWGWNGRNIETFERNLLAVVSGKPYSYKQLNQ